MTIIIFIISLAVLVAGNATDYLSSINFDLHGLREGNKLMQDKRGLFDKRKNLIGSIFLVTLPVVLFIVFPDSFIGVVMWNIVIGAVRGFTGLNNFKKARKKREYQIRYLRQFRDTINSGVGSVTIAARQWRGGTFYSTVIGVFTSDESSVLAAHDELERKLRTLVMTVPESMWFDRETLNKINGSVS